MAEKLTTIRWVSLSADSCTRRAYIADTIEETLPSGRSKRTESRRSPPMGPPTSATLSSRFSGYRGYCVAHIINKVVRCNQSPNKEGQEDVPVLSQLPQGRKDACHQAGRTPPAGPTAQDGQQDAVGIRVCHGRPPVEVVLRHLGVSCSSMEHPSCLKIWSSMSGRS